jgi:hypothetical protein
MEMIEDKITEELNKIVKKELEDISLKHCEKILTNIICALNITNIRCENYSFNEVGIKEWDLINEWIIRQQKNGYNDTDIIVLTPDSKWALRELGIIKVKLINKCTQETRIVQMLTKTFSMLSYEHVKYEEIKEKLCELNDRKCRRIDVRNIDRTFLNHLSTKCTDSLLLPESFTLLARRWVKYQKKLLKEAEQNLINFETYLIKNTYSNE